MDVKCKYNISDLLPTFRHDAGAALGAGVMEEKIHTHVTSSSPKHYQENGIGFLSKRHMLRC